MDRTKIYYLHYGNNIPFYVGKTNSSLRVRLNSHKCRYKNKNIYIEEIDKVLLIDWKFWESWYITLFKSWGYVLDNKNGGGGGLKNHLNETKLKISQSKKGIPNLALKGRPRPEISKALKGKKRPNLSSKLKGKPSPMKGKQFSQEHKEKIKATRAFLKSRPNTWQNLPVIQYDLNGNFLKEFESQKDATIFVNAKGDGVGMCCRGKQKTAYGYIWKFKNKII
jgi:hypothetical protein